jgi:hypothetical protein
MCTAEALDRGFKFHFGHGKLSELKQLSTQSFLRFFYNILKLLRLGDWNSLYCIWPYRTEVDKE